MSARRATLLVLSIVVPSCLTGEEEISGHGAAPQRAPYDTGFDRRQAPTCGVSAGQKTTDTIGPNVPHGNQLPFDRIVLLMQENRSFDHYYRGLGGGPAVLSGTDASGHVQSIEVPNYGAEVDVAGCDAARGHAIGDAHDCGGATEPDYNVDSWGAAPTKVHAFHETRYCTLDTAHDWEHVHREFNLADAGRSGDGLMDGFVAANNVYGPGGGGGRAMGYYDQTDIPYYYWLANTFATSDRHFCSLLGPTWPNRWFYLSATAFGRTRTPDSPVDLPTHDREARARSNFLEQLKASGHSVEVFRDGTTSFPSAAFAEGDYVGKSLWRAHNVVGQT